MNLSDLKPNPGSRKSRRRIGRGRSSGHGTTAGKGDKGQLARSGKKVRRDFEGGQMPLFRRVPKSGFTNIFRKEVVTVNLSDLDRFDDGSTVDIVSLKEKGLVRKKFLGPVKLLAKGEVKKNLTVKVSAFSKAAAAAIEKAGGKAEVVS